MGDSIDLRSISKFDGTNYQAWKFQLKAIFVANGLTGVVDGTCIRSIENAGTWDKSNAKAMVIISSTVEASQLEYLLTCETAKDMWSRLSVIHEQKSETNKLLLMTRFHDYKMASNDNVAQHIAKVENMARQLKDVGETVSNITIMAKILGSLPSKFSALVTAWDSVDTNNQTIHMLTQRLIKEEARMTVMDETSNALTATNVKHNQKKQTMDKKAADKRTQHPRKEITCFYCQKRGHIARECRKRLRETNNKESTRSSKRDEETSNMSAFVGETHAKEVLSLATEDIWLLDSGASKHMTFRRDWFSELQSCENEYVYLGDGTKCKVIGHGIIYIRRFVNGMWLDGRLEDVLYIPDLNKNLFSVGACVNKNYDITFGKDCVKFYMNDTLKAQGIKQNNNLFRMMIKIQHGKEANLAVSNLKRWHERLGHVN